MPLIKNALSNAQDSLLAKQFNKQGRANLAKGYKTVADVIETFNRSFGTCFSHPCDADYVVLLCVIKSNRSPMKTQRIYLQIYLA